MVSRLFVALGLLFGAAAARAAAFDCPTVPPRAPLVLPTLKAALEAKEPVVIVALGSSSTQGWRASDAAHTYPAELQAALNAALPSAHVAVINRGVGGQDATEEVARLDQDAIALKPQLVIWQVGANGAIADVDPAVFKRLVASGIARLRKAGADVVLMDNQRAPRVLAAPHHALIDQALAELAAAENVGLFSRGALMDAWRDAGAPYDAFVSDDRLHLNDRGYACTTAALAEAILDGLAAPQRTTLR